jgi:glycosyltransferase involved in cell wall biosynthesis
VTAVHQFLPTLIPGDAIGHHVLELRTLLRDAGVHSEIYAAEIDRDLRREARPYAQYPGGPDDVLLYHASTGSPMAAFVAARPEPKVVDYHNVTPGSFFDGWDPVQAIRLRDARAEIASLVRSAVVVVAHSRFSARDVHAWGHPDPVIAPVLGASFLEAAGVPDGSRARGDARDPEWLFVGRRAPNKAQHQLIKALALHRRLHGGAELHLVGRASPVAYGEALGRLAERAGVRDAVHVYDVVAPAALVERYRSADVFVSASAHEGYGLPLLEAMRFGVPVVARAAGAVPETAGGAALLVPGDSAAALAVAAHRVLSDTALRSAMVAAGRARVSAVGGTDAYRGVLERILVRHRR